MITVRNERKAQKEIRKVIKYLSKAGFSFVYSNDVMQGIPAIQSLPSGKAGYSLIANLYDRKISIVYLPDSRGADKSLLETANLSLAGTPEEEDVAVLTAEEICNRIEGCEFGNGPFKKAKFAAPTIQVD